MSFVDFTIFFNEDCYVINCLLSLGGIKLDRKLYLVINLYIQRKSRRKGFEYEKQNNRKKSEVI